MKKGRKPFAPKKVFNKYFDMSKVICSNYGKKVHYPRKCKAKKNGKDQFHASTTIEYETFQKDSSSEEYDDH